MKGLLLIIVAVNAKELDCKRGMACIIAMN